MMMIGRTKWVDCIQAVGGLRWQGEYVLVAHWAEMRSSSARHILLCLGLAPLLRCALMLSCTPTELCSFAELGSFVEMCSFAELHSFARLHFFAELRSFAEQRSSAELRSFTELVVRTCIYNDTS